MKIKLAMLCVYCCLLLGSRIIKVKIKIMNEANSSYIPKPDGMHISSDWANANNHICRFIIMWAVIMLLRLLHALAKSSGTMYKYKVTDPVWTEHSYTRTLVKHELRFMRFICTVLPFYLQLHSKRPVSNT